jgi:hypothetical protein
MSRIATFPAPVLLHRTFQYDLVRASLAPCTARHLKSPLAYSKTITTNQM